MTDQKKARVEMEPLPFDLLKTYFQVEMRSVERGICPIATSNERTVPIKL